MALKDEAPCPARELTEPLLAAGAAALARMIAAGEASAEAVMAAHLGRIAEVEPSIHAFAHLDGEAAMAAARAADAVQASGAALGPLHGVPVSIKDWIEAEGFVCDGGFEQRAGFRPKRDATVVARLKAAGAIVIGKTVTREGEPMYPRPCNPHDLARSPGASSSGEAAAIGSGGSPLGLGSDSGGSIRLPAHYSGVAGLKPTQGRVSGAGHWPPIGGLSDPRTAIGPMARRVADLELALGVIAGPDDRDPWSEPMPLGASADVDLRRLRIALVDFAGDGAQADVVVAVHAAGRALEAAGASVTTADLPILPESLEATEVYWARQASLSTSRWIPDKRARLSAERIDEGVFLWERLQRRVQAFMADHDVIVCPVAPTTAPLHRALDAADYLFTLPFSLTGQPALALPVALSAEGLPIGVQIVGRRWRDDVVLAVGRALEG